MAETHSCPGGFYVKYSVKELTYGKGLFAEEDIKAGTLIHVQEEGLNIKCFESEKEMREHLNTLPDYEAKKKWLEHTYAHDNKIYQSLDDFKYVNHSSEPNVQNGENFHYDYALKDIKKGDMLVEDYQICFEHPEWLMKLIAEYDVDPEFY